MAVQDQAQLQGHKPGTGIARPAGKKAAPKKPVRGTAAYKRAKKAARRRRIRTVKHNWRTVRRGVRTAAAPRRALRRRMMRPQMVKGLIVKKTGRFGLTHTYQVPGPTGLARRAAARRTGPVGHVVVTASIPARLRQLIRQLVHELGEAASALLMRLLSGVRRLLMVQVVHRAGRAQIRIKLLIWCPCRGTGQLPVFGPNGEVTGQTAVCPRHSATAEGRKRRSLSMMGLWWWLSCDCAGRGSIWQLNQAGQYTGSRACPRHGRDARGRRHGSAHGAARSAGLKGAAGWLAENHPGGRKTGMWQPSPRLLVRAVWRHLTKPSTDEMQRQAANAAVSANKSRFTGPTRPCAGRRCENGVVDKVYTMKLREAHKAELIARAEVAEKRPPSAKRLAVLAERAYPLTLCSQCFGLGRVPATKAGAWLNTAKLQTSHTPTRRQKATGMTPKKKTTPRKTTAAGKTSTARKKGGR